MEITLKINNRTKGGKTFLEFLKTLAKTSTWLDIPEEKDYPISKNIPNEETARIIELNKKSKGTRVKSTKELFEKLDI